MDWELREDQIILQRSARDVLSKECPSSLIQEFYQKGEQHSVALWQTLADLGWLGVALPPEFGGTGGTIFDAVLLAEELGRTVAPVPFISAAILGGTLIDTAGSDAQKKQFLPGIVEGTSIVALAMDERLPVPAPAGIQMRAERTDAGFTLSGEKVFVHDGEIATALIVPARSSEGEGPDGISLFLVDVPTTGVSIRHQATLTGNLCSVQFDRAKVPAERLLGPLNGGWTPLTRALDQGRLAICGDAVGGAQRAFELALDYAQNRVVFGRVIGSYQAISYKLIDMTRDTDSARVLLYDVAWRYGEGLARPSDVSMVKALAGKAYERVCFGAHSVFAGVGFMVEHPLHLYTRRAKALDLWLGDGSSHKEQVFAAMDLIGASGRGS